MPKLGIGIITYRRPEFALRTVERVQRLTRSKFSLVIADDGSPGDVVDRLREQARTITGPNRGCAWNKNRALFHLHEVERCDHVILLEDDTSPTAPGWEKPWVEASRRWGHMNFVGEWRAQAFRGGGTPASPYHSAYVSGQCSAFSREALSCVGYLDPRFRAFGWEHVEHTARMVRVGLGGYVSDGRIVGYQIDSALEMAAAKSHSQTRHLIENEALYGRIADEPVHRAPWRDDEQMLAFRAEQKASGFVALGWSSERFIGFECDLPMISFGRPATQSSVSSWTPGRQPEDDAANALDGVITGAKRFHTDHEPRPWWQVDLQSVRTIGEVRIFNAMGENADRANALTIAVSDDGGDWNDVHQRIETEPFGGADGRPLRWLPPDTLRARYVRISIASEQHHPLHLDQVAIYGLRE